MLLTVKYLSKRCAISTCVSCSARFEKQMVPCSSNDTEKSFSAYFKAFEIMLEKIRSNDRSSVLRIILSVQISQSGSYAFFFEYGIKTEYTFLQNFIYAYVGEFICFRVVCDKSVTE